MIPWMRVNPKHPPWFLGCFIIAHGEKKPKNKFNHQNNRLCIYIYIYTICTLLCIHCILPNIEFFPNKPWWTALNLLIPALWGEFSPGEPSKTPLSHPKNWLLIGYMMGVSTNGGIIGYMMGYIYTIHLYRYGCLFIVIGLDGEILAALFI